MSGLRMDWKRLLSPRRIRELLDGVPSRKQAGESRTEFERDRDRTVYSTPVRRLIGKTQVYPLNPNDVVRTRLIHSAEVSTVAEGLASQVANELRERKLIDAEQARSIAKIAETCGLLHDVGNPPFGHAGEAAVQTWFKEKASDLKPLSADKSLWLDFEKFDGNPQGFRLVTNTHLLGHNRGLNLTCATAASMCKYIAPAHSTDTDVHVRSKPGFFQSEKYLFDKVFDEVETGGNRHPIAILVEAADDIVNVVVDLEDGVKQKLITWEAIEDSLRSRGPETSLVSDILEATKRQISDYSFGDAPDIEYAQAFRAVAISALVRKAVTTFVDNYDSIMGGTYPGELVKPPASASKEFCKSSSSLLKANVFQSHDVLRLEIRGREVITDLMDLFWEGIKHRNVYEDIDARRYPDKLYLLISDNYRHLMEWRITRNEGTEEYVRLQLLVDFVSAMTDAYASRLHAELMNG